MGPGNLDGPHCRLIFDNSITLRSAQVRRISWVRGVRPVRERYEWPPHDAAPDRPPSLPTVLPARQRLETKQRQAPMAPCCFSSLERYLIFASRNSTCFLATGSYFFLVSFSVMVREFFLVT